jgi:hypothetical protein
MEEMLERALVHTQRARTGQGRSLILNALARSALLGPAPVDEALGRCEEIRAEARGDPTLEAVAVAMIGGLKAQLGRFDEARELYRRSRAIAEEFGLRAWLAALPLYSGPIELLADEPALAEAELRAGYDALVEMGELGRLSTEAAMLAEALYQQGRLSEAQHFTQVSADAAAPDDVFSQIAWRATLAKTLSHGGKTEEAERLAHEAVALAYETDGLNLHGDALLDLAEVEAVSRRSPTAAAENALALYERKGNLVSAALARAAIARLAAIDSRHGGA